MGEPMTGASREHVLVELEVAQLHSSVLALDEMLARVDGVMNLLRKALRAVDRGEPGDRAKALALVERAERFVPDDPGGDAERTERIDQLRTTIRDVREQALALPE